VFAGLLENRREACIDITDRNSTVGVNGVNCKADEVEGFGGPGQPLTDSIELDENNTTTQQPDVLAAFFANTPVNGAGIDFLVFETLNSDDPPTLTLVLNGVQIVGTTVGTLVFGGETLRAVGFDFTAFGIAADALVGEPIFIQTIRDAQNTPIGSSDVVAIVAVNQAVIPLPAAAPLFFAGLAGLAFATGRRRKK
jgi:hypothetical protein